MPAPYLSYWYRADITLKNKIDFTTVTYALTSRPPFSEAFGVIDDYFPILKSIRNIGTRMDQFLPRSATGTVNIINTAGSFGFERRFSDLFDRYTPIDQTIKLYYADTTYNANSPAGSGEWTQFWESKVISYRLTTGSLAEIQLTLASDLIPRKPTVFIIDSTNTPSAPQEALGKALPILFGSDVQCKGIRVSADGSATPRYASATTLSNQFVASGLNSILVKGRDGNYIEVADGGATTASIDVAANFLLNTSSTVGHFGTTTNAFNEICYRIYADPQNYLITHVRWKGKGIATGGAVYTGRLICTIYEEDPVTGLPGESLGTAYRDKSDFNPELNSTTEFDVDFVFQRPIPLDGNKRYQYGIQETVDASGDPYKFSWKVYEDNIATSDYRTVLVNDKICGFGGPVGHFYKLTTTFLNPNVKFYAVKFDQGTQAPGTLTESATGYSYWYYDLTQQTAISGIDNPSLDDLDLIFNHGGFKDDGSGTITGSAGSFITNPVHALKLLSYEWNGSTWASAKYNFSKFSATHAPLASTSSVYYRKITGRTRGRVLLRELVQEICRNAGLRVVQYNNATTPLAVWAWGTNQSATVTITDEDASIIDITQEGSEKIINLVEMYYANRLNDLDITKGSATGQFKDYLKSKKGYYLTAGDTLAAELSTISTQLFGPRYLADPTFDFIDDEDSANAIYRFFASVYGIPHLNVRFEIPLFKYSSLESLDVVNLVHPDMPSFFGTTSNAKNPTYSTDDVSVTTGHYFKRAKSYRVLIEDIQRDLEAEDYPKMIISARVLNNYPKDPT